MRETFQDRVWPVFDDLMFDTDYYSERAKAKLASELQAEQRLSRIQARDDLRQLRLTRKRARRARYLRWQPIIWTLIVLVLLWLGLGGAHWLVGA